MNKYRAKRTWSRLCDRWFASKAECLRGETLHLLQRAGKISGLEYQVRFILNKRPIVSITIDFRYIENGQTILEDSKGMMTRDFRTKMAWLKQKHGYDVMLSGQENVRKPSIIRNP